MDRKRRKKAAVRLRKGDEAEVRIAVTDIGITAETGTMGDMETGIAIAEIADIVTTVEIAIASETVVQRLLAESKNEGEAQTDGTGVESEIIPDEGALIEIETETETGDEQAKRKRTRPPKDLSQ